MPGYLIKDTTREEREQIVADSLGNIEATCDGCGSGLVEMYQAYIDGEKNSGRSIWSFMPVIFPVKKDRKQAAVPFAERR